MIVHWIDIIILSIVFNYIFTVNIFLGDYIIMILHLIKNNVLKQSHTILYFQYIFYLYSSLKYFKLWKND